MPPTNGVSSKKSDVRFVTALAAGWLFFLWSTYILAAMGCFSIWTIGIVAAITLGGTGRLIYSQASWPSRSLAIVLLVGTSVTIWYGSFSIDTPTLFTGRDQGSYGTAAMRLAQTGHIATTTPASLAFFDIYGPGKALNFPGFAYSADGALVPQFPLGYILWLAEFIVFLGPSGIAVGNGVAFLLGLIFFWSLLRRFATNTWAATGLAIAITSFPLVWFERFTLSENLAWPMFTLLSFLIIHWLDTRSRLTYILVWLAALFLAFTRIEGWAFLAISGTILVFSPSAVAFRKNPTGKQLSLILLPIIAILTAINLWINFAFFRSLGRTLYREWFASSQNPFGSTSPGWGSGHQELWSLLWLYGLAPIFIIGFLGGLILWKRKKWLVLTPLLLALPTCLYFIDPHISNDHPWLLRRFAFSLWPALLFTAIIATVRVGDFLRQRTPQNLTARLFTPALLTFFFLSQVSVLSGFLFHREHADLIQSLAPIAEHFGPRDLVLVDRLSSGNPWTLLAGPLETIYGTNAAYFFNMDDLDRLPLDRFDRVFLLINTDSALPILDRFGNDLNVIYAYQLTPEHFEYVNKSEAHFPKWQTDDIYGFILEYEKQ